MRPQNLLLLAGLTLLPQASAWGMLGHRTVALLASRYLLPETATWIKSLLPGSQTMVTASTWPDYYAHTPDGRYSAPWHWIDSKDNPPHTCEVNYSRDCHGKEGCIVSALVNMTARVTDKEISFYERSMALKFLIHFLGDIHQPLHTEDLLRGGNQISVLWGRQHTNLHHVWDSSIAEKHAGGNAIRHAVSWADSLYTSLEDGGKYAAKREEWAGCVDPKKAEECALEWAGESNRWMCEYVLPKTYPEGFEGGDLSGGYYEGAVPVVEELVAKAGWRLAGYLNMLVAGKTGLEDSERGRVVGVEVIVEEEEEEEEVVEVRGGSGGAQEVFRGEGGARPVLRGVDRVLGRANGWWGRVWERR